MGSRFLTDLASVCRKAGLDVVEVEGWQTRARGSGGYNSGLPNHVIVHHTASGKSSDGWPDVNYCTFNDDDAPLCNLYLNRTGTVWVCAGGATNTNGSGSDPCNVTADDSMNSSAIGIEAGNDGKGEVWSRIQVDAYLQLVDALCEAYGIPTSRVHSHAEWAPQRKVDPAGPDIYASGSGTWDMDDFRDDLDETPPPDEGGGFLMALTDQQQSELYDRIMGSLPGAYSNEVRGPGMDGAVRTFAMDDADGAYLVSMVQLVMAEVQALRAEINK